MRPRPSRHPRAATRVPNGSADFAALPALAGRRGWGLTGIAARGQNPGYRNAPSALTTSVQIELPTPQTGPATWHGAERGDIIPPQAAKSRVLPLPTWADGSSAAKTAWHGHQHHGPARQWRADRSVTLGEHRRVVSRDWAEANAPSRPQITPRSGIIHNQPYPFCYDDTNRIVSIQPHTYAIFAAYEP